MSDPRFVSLSSSHVGVMVGDAILKCMVDGCDNAARHVAFRSSAPDGRYEDSSGVRHDWYVMTAACDAHAGVVRRVGC